MPGFVAVMAMLCFFFGEATHDARAQVGSPGITVVPVGFCQFSPSSAATLGASCPAGKYAWVCTSAAAYWRDDGTAAVGTTGIPLGAIAGQPFCIWYAGTLSNFSIISSSGVISASIYK